MAEKGGNTEKTDTTAAVQGATAAVQRAMIETWECTEDDCVFAFGQAVIAAVQRPETHICIDSGASRSACPFGYTPDKSAKGTTTTLFSIDGYPIEQRGYKKVHFGRNVIRLVRRNVLVPRWSSQVSCSPVASVSSLEENVVFLRFLPDSTANASATALSRSFTREVAETQWNMLVAGGSTSQGR